MTKSPTIVFDITANIRQRVADLSTGNDARPTLRRQGPTNYNLIFHLQEDIENNWPALPTDLRATIGELFNIRELPGGDVVVELK